MKTIRNAQRPKTIRRDVAPKQLEMSALYIQTHACTLAMCVGTHVPRYWTKYTKLQTSIANHFNNFACNYGQIVSIIQ